MFRVFRNSQNIAFSNESMNMNIKYNNKNQENKSWIVVFHIILKRLGKNAEQITAYFLVVIASI